METTLLLAQLNSDTVMSKSFVSDKSADEMVATPKPVARAPPVTKANFYSKSKPTPPAKSTVKFDPAVIRRIKKEQASPKKATPKTNKELCEE